MTVPASILTALLLASPVGAARTVKQHVWHAPRWWLKEALCIHDHEGAWNDNTGNTYFGGMQFLRSTWESVGGGYYASFAHPGDSRYPFTASPREQLYRAWLVWKRDGGSWREWGTAGACGLR